MYKVFVFFYLSLLFFFSFVLLLFLFKSMNTPDADDACNRRVNSAKNIDTTCPRYQFRHYRVILKQVQFKYIFLLFVLVLCACCCCCCCLFFVLFCFFFPSISFFTFSATHHLDAVQTQPIPQMSTFDE